MWRKFIFSCKIGALQYYPAGAETISSNHLFAQCHAHYPSSDKEALIKGLISGVLPTRVIFATIAFGMGIDLPNIRKVAWKNIFRKWVVPDEMACMQKH